MEAPDFVKKVFIKKLLKEMPVMGKLISWLTDPNAVGRKRTIATIAALIAGCIRGGEATFKAACDAGTFAVAVCKVNPGLIAGILDNVVLFLNTVVVNGADTVTILMGVWGLWAARNKPSVIVK